MIVNMSMIDDGFEALLEPFYNGKKLTDPVSTKDDKFQLLPAFLKVKGKLLIIHLVTILVPETNSHQVLSSSTLQF